MSLDKVRDFFCLCDECKEHADENILDKKIERSNACDFHQNIMWVETMFPYKNGKKEFCFICKKSTFVAKKSF